jgi:8-oxo-dGTP diphosphatase
LPDVFEIPGGHIDYGEDIVDGLKREITEELGMTVSVGEPFAAFTYVNDIKDSHSIEVIYFATFNEPIENITLHPEDYSEYRWFAEDELGQAASEDKPLDDVEMIQMKRGFELLRGDGLRVQ